MGGVGGLETDQGDIGLPLDCDLARLFLLRGGATGGAV